MKNVAAISIIACAQLFCNVNVCAQSDTIKVCIGGEVLDSESKNEGVAWATIRLSSMSDSTKTYVTSTDTEGRFKIEDVKKGKYHVEVSCIGYESHAIDITFATDTILPPFALKTSAKMLDEVRVNALYTKVNKKGDYLVQVKGNPLAKVSSMENFLRSIRGVAATEDLRVFGRAGAVILLNDRAISYEQLKNIPTSMVERIEIQQQAPTEYASSGIKPPLLRVVLRNEPGLIGSVGLYPGYYADKSWYMNEAVDILYSVGKFSVLNNFGNSNGKSRGILEQDVHYEDHDTHQESESLSKTKRAISDNLNMRYSFTERDYVDVNASYSTNKNSDKNLGNGDGTQFDQYDLTSSYSDGIGVKVYKALKKDDVSNIIVSASYSESHSNNDRDYDLHVSGTQQMNLKNNHYRTEIYSKATYALDKRQTIGAGLRYGSSSDVNRIKGNGENTIRYMDDTESKLFVAQTHGWIEYSNLIADKYNLSAEVNFDHYKVDYEDWLTGARNKKISNGVYCNASCFIPFNLQKQHYLNVAARYSFSYPNYGYYSPIVVYQNDKQYSRGDVNLDLEKIISFDAVYSLNQHLSVSYSYMHRSNLVSVFMHQDANDPTVYYTSPENAGHSNTHELGINYKVNPIKIWTINSSLSGELYSVRTPSKRLDVASADLYLHNNFSLTNNTGINLLFRCFTPYKTISVKSSWNYFVGLGAYSSFFNNHLRMSVSFDNLIYKKRVLTTIGDGWEMERKNKLSDFRIQYNVVWNFNAGKKIRGRRVESVSTGYKALPTL